MHFMWKCSFSLKDICKRTRDLPDSLLRCTQLYTFSLWKTAAPRQSTQKVTESSPLAAHRGLFPHVAAQQTLMHCLTHPLHYWGRNLCQAVLFVHNGSHSSERQTFVQNHLWGVTHTLINTSAYYIINEINYLLDMYKTLSVSDAPICNNVLHLHWE